MKNKRLFSSICFGLFLVLVIGSIVFYSPKTSAQKQVTLFSLVETPQARAESEKYSPASVREGEIVFQNNLIERENSESLLIPLFDGKTYEAIRNKSEGFEMRGADDFTWRGKIFEGKIPGDVVLTFKNGYVAGLIYSPDSVYEVAIKGGKQILVELDQSLYPECAGDTKGESGVKRPELENAGAAVDSGDRIDVLVVYTTATKNVLGGDAAAQTFSQQAIDSTNTTYINSKIRQRLRLAHATEYVYTEVSSSTDLAGLRTSAVIQSLRETHKADLVAYLGEISGVCGQAYLMGNPVGNQNNGYSVTARNCAIGNLTFAHELGHNMGSAHNPENGSGASYFYGYGHWVNGNYRTVMSYVNPCTSGCTRRPYFSNPSIGFNGVPTGVNNQRDNARSINNTADVIANYRYSGTSLTLTNYNAGETIPRNIARQINWNSDNLGGNVKIEISRDESTTWETLIASTPNSGSATVNIYGRPTRLVRIRITSLSNPIVSDSSVRNIFIK